MGVCHSVRTLYRRDQEDLVPAEGRIVLRYLETNLPERRCPRPRDDAAAGRVREPPADRS